MAGIVAGIPSPSIASSSEVPGIEKFRKYVDKFSQHTIRTNEEIARHNWIYNKNIPQKEPIIFNGIIDGQSIEMRIRIGRYGYGYDSDMFVFNDPDNEAEYYTWRAGKPFDRFMDTGVKGNVLGRSDAIQILDAKNMESIWWAYGGTYSLKKWRKPQKGEVCKIDDKIYLDCLEGKADYDPRSAGGKVITPELTGVYQKIGHAALLEKRRVGIALANARYQRNLTEVINSLAKQGKL